MFGAKKNGKWERVYIKKFLKTEIKFLTKNVLFKKFPKKLLRIKQTKLITWVISVVSFDFKFETHKWILFS